MGTRARIGIELKDGSVLSAYHHWDGYPEWLGKMLKTHFNSKEAAAELIDGGDMSSCWTNCGWQNETRPETGPMYYSERGEECPPRLDKDLGAYLLHSEEYTYVFTELSGWLCYNTREWDDAYMEGVEIPA